MIRHLPERLSLGQWVEGRREGNGKMVYSDGAEYVGEWARDVPHGKGTIRWTSGLLEEYSVLCFFRAEILDQLF